MTIAVTWDVGPGASPSFFVPFNDLGAGAVNTTPLTSLGSPTATFTRATATWTKLSTGLWASVASGTAASMYLGADTTVGAYGGYIPQGARINNALWSRDLTNIVWSPTNITPTLDAVGIDGAANTATTLTATAGNGTLLQAITLASQANVFQPFVKRKTGTGVVNITVDGGTTWTPITINASTFTQVQVTKTAANPSIGFQIVTNTDAIIVDMADMQNGTTASTPIPTTTIAVQRNADQLTYPTANNINGTQGSAYAEWTAPYNVAAGSVNPRLIDTGDAGLSIPLYLAATNGKVSLYDSVGASNGTAPTYPATTVQKSASSWSGTSGTISVNGTNTAITFSGNLGIATTIGIGNRGTGGTVGNELNGTIKNIRIYPTALSAAQLRVMTT